ncbi:LOW QUALITY PROTEIN: DUF3675 domain-containing protein/RINGv domain-containing protein [Cephalotus follicularis]|uniref:DUF3675 domain-containing protein/RINGv domain-containing protein n=1 Tax=Cephalotus follicularis TaxID=3775 RepID=A0A1Q3C6K4_CEPFO|nr:LOW QUALITY PROTEIN: DUF3675 domain-containing protein/RINGv domain-containing protein [Cephalotus follicularis]
MGDHFVLLVDRLLTESTLEAAIESKNQPQQAMSLVIKDDMTEFSCPKFDVGLGSPSKLVECRICHDEDQDKNMEIQSCCLGLQYAHRKCVQRWCNEKGDTTCEICRQQYKPGYTAPPPLFHYGGIPMNFRGNLEISRRDQHNPRFIAMMTTDHEYVDSDLDDYSAPSFTGLICCHFELCSVYGFLVLRHTLPIIISGAGDYSLTLLTVRQAAQFVLFV